MTQPELGCIIKIKLAGVGVLKLSSFSDVIFNTKSQNVPAAKTRQDCPAHSGYQEGER